MTFWEAYRWVMFCIGCWATGKWIFDLLYGHWERQVERRALELQLKGIEEWAVEGLAKLKARQRERG